MRVTMSKTTELLVIVLALALIAGDVVLRAMRVPADGFDEAVPAVVAVIVTLVGANGIANTAQTNTADTMQKALACQNFTPASDATTSTATAASAPVVAQAAPVAPMNVTPAVVVDPTTGTPVQPLATG